MAFLYFYLKNHVASGRELLPTKRQVYIPLYIPIIYASIIHMYIFCIDGVTPSAFKRFAHQ